MISLTHPDVSKRVEDLITEAYREFAALKLIESSKITVVFFFLDQVVGLFPCCWKSPSHCCVRLLNVSNSAQGNAGLLHCCPYGVTWGSQTSITVVLVGWLCSYEKDKRYSLLLSSS